MQDERGNETELFRYLNALRRCVEQSRRSRIIGADEEVEQSDQIFRAIFENAADGILLVDLENRKFYIANRVLCQMLGYSQDELKALEIGDIHPEKDLPYITEQFERQAREELTHARNIPVKRKDGSVFFADINSFPITFGRKTYLMGIFRDITQHKKAEEKLRRSEETFRLAMEATNDALWDWNMVTNEVYRNPRHATMLGYEPQELTASQEEWEKRIHPDDKPFVLGFLDKHLKGQKGSYHLEYRLLTKSGEYIWILGRGKIVAYNSDGSPARMIGTNVDITERKKSEEELRKFKAVADRAGYGVGMIDLDGRLTYVNDTFAQMHGYHAAELIGKHVSIFHSEEQMDVIDRLNQKLIETGSFLSEEVWHTRKDGTTFCALTNGTLIRDEHGKPQFLAATAVDITHRKNMETALAESEEKYRTLVESSTDAICILDAKGAFLFANRNTAEHLKVQTEDLLGKTLWDYLPKKDATQWVADMRQVVESRQDKSVVRETEFEGQHFWYHTKLLPLGDGHGGTVVMAVSRDIGDIKRAEERIRTLSSAVEQSIDGIAIGDLDRRLVYVNAAYARMHGYSPEEMVGMSISDVHHNNETEDYTEIVHQIDSQRSWTGEVEHVGKNGAVFTCYLSATCITDDRGEITGRLVVCRDVTESKKRDEELNTYREKMARAEQLASLGTLSATVAHQITQPLTVIRLSLDNVVDELEGTSCSSTVLRRLRDSVAQVSGITTIINRFRNYARHSSDTTFGQVNVQAVVIRIARLLAESAKQARVTLNVEDMSALPPIVLPEREFEQILFALVENAIQAADGKKNRRIVISGSVEDEHIELRFSDTCGGIPPENLDKIFEPFFTTKPRGQGTGLGLCIVQDAVARVGGRVRVESKLGKGSTFFVTLPIYED